MARTRFSSSGHDDGARRGPNLDVPLGQSSHKHNGRRRFGWRDEDESAPMASCLSIFVDVYRHHAAVFARYRAEDRCSEKQLRTIEALYIEGLGLHEFSEREGVTPQAVSARILGLANKAPEFYRWWRNVNAAHRRSNTLPPKRCRER